jgi:hypothetical protein
MLIFNVLVNILEWLDVRVCHAAPFVFFQTGLCL